MPILTHAPSAPLSSRLDRLVDRARSEARTADSARRARAAADAENRGESPAKCSGCGIYLLPIEVAAGVCRYCREA